MRVNLRHVWAYVPLSTKLKLFVSKTFFYQITGIPFGRQRAAIILHQRITAELSLSNLFGSVSPSRSLHDAE